MSLDELIKGLAILGVYPPATGGGSGTVTNVGTGTGLTGGPITTTGVISLAPISTLTVLSNITGGSAAPIENTITAIFDAVFDNTQGDILYRNGTVWTFLAPGTAGQVLVTGGIGANPYWTGGTGGSVTSVATGTGLTGGTITSTGTISLASVASLTILCNITGGSAAPIANTLTALIDATLGNTQGDILYRNGTVWTVLAPGTAGQLLQTGGAASNPSWTTTGTGTVTSVATGTGLTGGTISTTGTISLAPITSSFMLANLTGGSSAPLPHSVSAVFDYVFNNAQGNILYRGNAGWTYLPPGTSGYVLTTHGASANPAWVAPAVGTVSSVATGTGLTGGTITSTGTISFAPVVNGSILSNISGGSAVPVANSLQNLMAYAFGNTQGSVLYCSATGWTHLAPGTPGYVLTTHGASANPTWSAGGGGGGGITYNVVTTSTQLLTTANGYIVNDSGAQVVFSLPVTSNVGDYYTLVGSSVDGWMIAQNAGQNILLNGISTTVGTGGSLTSDDATAGLTIICTVANTTFIGTQQNGSITIV